MESILHDLGIEPNALAVNIAGFILLLFLMRRLLFGPVGQVVERRKQQISDDLDAAQADRETAARRLTESRDEGRQIVEQAQSRADEVAAEAKREADEAIRQARETARETERSARAATERDRREAAAELRDEVGESAARMCRAILQQALDAERHRALMDKFIADVEQMAAERRETP